MTGRLERVFILLENNGYQEFARNIFADEDMAKDRMRELENNSGDSTYDVAERVVIHKSLADEVRDMLNEIDNDRPDLYAALTNLHCVRLVVKRLECEDDI